MTRDDQDKMLRKLVVLSNVVEHIAMQVTSAEGDEEATEDDFGIDAAEVVEMAHDNMILIARAAVERVNKIESGEI